MGQHGVVVIFVVQLQDLNEVVEASLVLAVLGGLVDGEDLVLGQHLLSLLGGASNLSDCLEGGVQVAGSDEVTSEEGVNLAISLEVIDIKGEVDSVNFLLLESKFLEGEREILLIGLTDITVLVILTAIMMMLSCLCECLQLDNRSY